MEFDKDKFKALMHYACEKCGDPRKLGATKLNKILWFSDVIAFLKFGETITGARYVKQKFGPVPKAVLPCLRELEKEGMLRIEEDEYFGKPKREYIVLTPADVSVFSAEERELIDYVVDAICDGHTASSISELTHDDIWKIAEIDEDIPPYAVLASKLGQVTDHDVARAREAMDAAA